MIFAESSGYGEKYSGCRLDHSHHTLSIGHALPYTSCPEKKTLYMFLTSDVVFLTMSSVMEDEQVVPTDYQLPMVPLTQCPTNAQSAPDMGNIDVNPELLVNAIRIVNPWKLVNRVEPASSLTFSGASWPQLRIESRSLTLEANLGELQRLVKLRNSSGATSLIGTSGSTTAITGFAENNHSVGQLHAFPDKGTIAAISQRDQKNQNFIHLTNVADKGKGIIENDSRYMWNVIIPNSPGYDGDIVIDENLSTLPPVVGGGAWGCNLGL
ncbi:uncharacterized protein DS421_7g222070 [Arachis hypogaea]|nr:uncharacterized protein DS421_7g222070 [Arachis hypogaea]